MPAPTRPIFCVLVSLLLFSTHPGAVRAEGIQIVLIERRSPDSWYVREYIDNALVGALSTISSEDAILLPPSVKVVAGAENAEINILAAESQPLIVFVSDHVTPLEERIASAGQAQEAVELRLEQRRQVLGGLFAVPFWPYLAASEVPLQGINIERTSQIKHWRETMFPAAIYGASGNVPGWFSTGLEEQAAVLQEGDSAGTGRGISLDYIISGSVSGYTIQLAGDADVAALYSIGGQVWEPSGGDAVQVSHLDLVGSLEERHEGSSEPVRYSTQHIRDDEGNLSRYLAAVTNVDESVEFGWSVTGETSELPGDIRRAGINLTLAIVLCWILFGLAVVLGNWLFRFSTIPVLSLLGAAMAIYPLYLGISFLLAGLFGLGFIPGAVLSAGILSAEGYRLKASGVILASGFLTAIASQVIWT